MESDGFYVNVLIYFDGLQGHLCLLSTGFNVYFYVTYALYM